MLHQLALRIGVTRDAPSSSAAGPNGLAAAIRLAEAGRDVTVLEAADAPGGAVRTEELTLPGFRHDTFSSVYPAARRVAGVRAHAARAPRPGVGPPRRVLRRTRCPTASAIALYRDVDATAASLDALPPGDGERWARVRRARSLDALRRACGRRCWPASRRVGGAAEAARRRSGPPGALRFGAAAARPARRARRAGCSTSGDARAWLYGAAVHGDAPPTAPGSAIAAAYLNLLGHAVGWPSPRGGARAR